MLNREYVIFVLFKNFKKLIENIIEIQRIFKNSKNSNIYFFIKLSLQWFLFRLEGLLEALFR